MVERLLATIRAPGAAWLACSILWMAASAGPVHAQTSNAAGEREKSASKPHAREPRQRFYNGSFFEPIVRGGWTSSDGGEFKGWNVDFSVRHSFLFLIGDVRFSYRLDGIRPSAGDDYTHLHSIQPHLAIHPLALLLLGSDWLSYTIASLYFDIGAGLRMINFSEPPGTEESLEIAGVWSIGTGLDIPLGDADTGLRPWLHVAYRYNRGEFPGADPSRNIELHAILVGLGLRANGSLF